MDRNWIVAGTVAVVIHGGLAWALRRGPMPTALRSIVPAVLLNKFELPVEPPDEPEIAVATEAPPGRPDPFTPRSLDTPVADPGPFTRPVSTLPAVEVKHVAFVGETSIGVPDGVGTDIGAFIAGAVNLDNPPRTRVQIAPHYPHEARAGGRNGEVHVEFVVDEAGRVVNPRVVRSSDRVFDEPTLRAVSKWRFEPGRLQGTIVRFRMAVPVVFNFNEA